MLKLYLLTVIILATTLRSNCQSSLPEVLEQGTIPEQLKYIEDRTRIYENYRAIREDMYQKVSRNTLDSLAKAKNNIKKLAAQTSILENRIDSLNKKMEASDNKLAEATRTKDSIRVLGMEVNKVTYNAVMWTLLAAFLFLLLIGLMSFRRNRTVTLRTKKDLEELKEEFEEYRQKTRLERERVNREHFNEIKKLKGGGSARG
ncbi:MAG: hypothetical protein JXK95_15595 [Bacteroidales bacterium]|nr:hypothetical protein [Bacteroidales bacterium]